MQHVAQQLARVRSTGRLLLIVRRLAQCVALLVPILIILGLVDYLLRLPGPLRLGLGLIVAGVTLYWLATRLYRAARFSPSIPELALRVERVYPQLAGSFASAVEFSLAANEYASPATTAGMAQSAIAEMQGKLAGIKLNKLLYPMPTIRAVAMALLSLALLGGVVGAAPDASATAFSRWAMPLGDAQWPKRNAVEVATPQAVYPVDSKIRLRAQVTQGLTNGMQMVIRYRVVDRDGAVDDGAGQWTTVRVNEQRAEAAAGRRGVYETLVDVPPATARALMSGQRDSATLEVTYTAGDDTSPVQTLTLAARPEIAQVNATLTPPTYAAGLVSKQDVALHEQSDRIAACSAYIGSAVNLAVQFNKPLPESIANAAATNAGLPDTAKVTLTRDNNAVTGFTARWTLNDTATFGFRLTDSFGLSSTDSDRQYRIQALEDELPAVVLLKPAIDEAVLASAVVPLQATSEDDIAMQSLRLRVVVPDRANTPEDAETLVTRELRDPAMLTTGRVESLDLDHTIELAGLGLIPGDEVFITALGRDIYQLDGLQHDEIASETRRIRVITEQELADQVRRVLRGIRNTAQSLERNQRLVAERTERGEPAETAGEQADLTRRIAAQRDQLDAVRERLDRNAPENLEGLERLMDRAEGLLDSAREASDQAEQQLREAAEAKQQAQAASAAGEQAQTEGNPEAAQEQQAAAEQAEQEQTQSQEQAGEQQEQAQRQLNELVAALDMGESVGEVESELSSILDEAERIAQDTRELLPKTVGQKIEDLPEEVQQELVEAAERQAELAERAEALIDKMRATADEIGEQGETPEQRATAKTLAEAAAVAERQGLEQNTEEAAENLEENQVADAATQQQQAISTLEQMMAELGKQQDRRQEELQRLLQELAQKIQKLVDDQEAQLARAEQAGADALAVLEQPQFDLRRRTMLTEAEATEAPDTQSIAAPLGRAVQHQAEAVKSIRAADKQATVGAETLALEQLRMALELVNEQQDQQQQDQQRQERLKLRQEYYDLADKQDALIEIVNQHLQDQPYSRRDWRQINEVHKEALDSASFDEAQQAIRAKAAELEEAIGDSAMVYQSMHRRIEQATARAGKRLGDRITDPLVVSDQVATARLLRSMGDAMDDAALEEKFEKDEQGGGQGGGGGQGEGEEPPLVPDLAQIKLLRELMITMKAQTEELDGMANRDDPAYQQRLDELAETQRELGELGDQLLEKLREQMQPPEEEERN